MMLSDATVAFVESQDGDVRSDAPDPDDFLPRKHFIEQRSWMIA